MPTPKVSYLSYPSADGDDELVVHLNHKSPGFRLVRLYAVCTREEPYLIVTEFMKNGSLLDYLKKPENILSHKALVDMCAQIAHGMTFLEERKLVHRDLAARNILVGDKISGIPEVKVADFGLARIMEEEVYEAAMGAKFPIKW